MTDRKERTARLLMWMVAACFGVGVFAWSAWRWATFRYGTFDLAFYVQALWLALHGEWQVSLLGVPLLGNHAEPIVFLALPLFAVWQHPLLLVGLQTIALASLPLTGYRVARALGLEQKPAFMLAAALVLFPATGFVGLHEFHPEALAAPFLLLAYEARLRGWLGRYWLWWVCALATKENIALLLVTWAVVHLWTDRKRGLAHQGRWNLLPGAAALAWLLLYAGLLAPALNGGKVDYFELYSHLGRSGAEVVRGFVSNPASALTVLRASVTGGDLVWGTLLPFLALPLLRPRWIVIAAPILLQHLLSWRSSEWSIRFHYAAPLIPLFWIATAEVLSTVRWRVVGGWLVLIATAACQAWRGPVRDIGWEIAHLGQLAWERQWKAAMLAEYQSAPELSVTAAQPYLSHLATRRDLHSLHHVLKGLQTLSRRRYEPPPATDLVLIDANDASTFSAGAGYYHPTMRTAEGDLIPSSEQLLHDFLAQAAWQTNAINSLSIMRRTGPQAETESAAQTAPDAATIAGRSVEVSGDRSTLRIRTHWQLTLPRAEFRWLSVMANKGDETFEIVRGLIAPEATGPNAVDHWEVRVPPGTSPGVYRVRLLVTNRLRESYDPAVTHGELGAVTQIVAIGDYDLRPPAE